MGPGALGLCEGDCHTDVGCAGDLIFEQRTWHNGWEPVPGYDGERRGNGNYCQLPDPLGPTKSPAPQPKTFPTQSPNPQVKNCIVIFFDIQFSISIFFSQTNVSYLPETLPTSSLQTHSQHPCQLTHRPNLLILSPRR